MKSSRTTYLVKNKKSDRYDLFCHIKYGNNTQEGLEYVVFITGTMCDPNEPHTFLQAWWNPDKVAREKWLEAIR